MNILVSACLLGVKCRYSGEGYCYDEVACLKERHHLIPICPEILGGLSTPREPVEIVGDRVLTCKGKECTANFQRGAEETIKLAKLFECQVAILKSNSPSCGYGKVYDGTFSGRLVVGNGITAEALSKENIKIYNEHNCNKLKA